MPLLQKIQFGGHLKAPNDNNPISQETWNALKENTVKQLSNQKLFIVDTFCGANENTRLKVFHR